MNLRLLLRCFPLLLCLGVVLPAQAQSLFRGMTEAELIESAGPARSEMGSSAKKVLMYGWGEAELRQGRLYNADGMTMDYFAPDGKSQFAYSSSRGWTLNGQPIDANFRFTAKPDNAPTNEVQGVSFYRPGEENQLTALPADVQVGAPPPPPPPPPPAEVVKPEAPAPQPSAAEGPVVEEEEMAPEGFSSYEDNDYDEDDMSYYGDAFYEEYEPTTAEKIIEMAVRLLVEFVLTLIIVKIAFENQGFPVLMKQLLPLALLQGIVSFALDLGFEAIGYHSWAVEQGIEFITLSTLIYMLTDVTQAMTAMTIAIIARTVTFFVNMGLVFLIVNYGFGYF